MKRLWWWIISRHFRKDDNAAAETGASSIAFFDLLREHAKTCHTRLRITAWQRHIIYDICLILGNLRKNLHVCTILCARNMTEFGSLSAKWSLRESRCRYTKCSTTPFLTVLTHPRGRGHHTVKSTRPAWQAKLLIGLLNWCVDRSVQQCFDPGTKYPGRRVKAK